MENKIKSCDELIELLFKYNLPVADFIKMVKSNDFWLKKKLGFLGLKRVAVKGSVTFTVCNSLKSLKYIT